MEAAPALFPGARANWRMVPWYDRSMSMSVGTNFSAGATRRCQIGASRMSAIPAISSARFDFFDLIDCHLEAFEV